MDVVALINADDDLLLQRAVERWIADARADDPEAAITLVDASEIEHLPELRTTSLFGGRSCVVLRGVEAVTGSLKAEIEAYLDDPAPDATLVLAARGVGRIPKIAKLAGAAGQRVDLKRPADWDDRAWTALVGEEFARLGRQAEAAAIAALRAHAGTDTAAIASQVASVCAVASGAGTITAADVEAVVEGQGRSSGFAIADAVVERDPAAALVALRGALGAGEAPLALLGALVFRSRQLLQVRAGASPREAGMSPGQHRRMQGMVRRFGPGELAWCHDRLAELDLELKGSELPDDLVLEAAVVELATPREVGAPWNPMAATTTHTTAS
jgi:DNA polymerase III subunit delta